MNFLLALAFMMSHMHVQRRKHLRNKTRSTTSSTTGPSTAIASKKESTTPVKQTAPKNITSKLVPDAIIEGTASATPARSTRSRSKAQ